jgi:hypothetical protein
MTSARRAGLAGRVVEVSDRRLLQDRDVVDDRPVIAAAIENAIAGREVSVPQPSMAVRTSQSLQTVHSNRISAVILIRTCGAV